ncbi:unnamed protein product [Larinioides sclopetarius]|uniref:Fibronectin type-III domain-containing protein n=1 Tax=Larinioides sclopetarius TaxID=280406 RepID=A0AAV2BG35_9ARAC
MAWAAVLLLCVFLGLTDTTIAQLTDSTAAQIIDTVEPSTLSTTTLPQDDPCFADWDVNVYRNFTVRWDGVDREATIFVYIEPIETYGDDCLKKLSFSESFHVKEAPPVLDPPCFNSGYQVDVKLSCGGETENKYSTQIWTEPDAPSNVSVISITSSSFRVTWEKPPGTIEEYKVKVNSVEETTTATYRDVTNLEPVTEYKIQVSAKNSLEWGKWSEEITIETEKIELPTPQNLRVLNVTDTTINAAWDKVRFKNYTIAYCLRFRSGRKQKGLNTTNTIYTIKWLSPHTKYFIRVRAFIVGSTGNWTETLAVTTLPGVPSVPENVTEIEVDSVSIEIQWTEPSPSTGPIQFYTVQWSESLNLLEFQQAVTNATSYAIKNLIPLTSYDISVSAATDAGVGNWTPAIQVKTKDPVPPENFRNVSASSSSISLEWDEPNIYKGRGIMVAYSIRWNSLKFPYTFSPNTTDLSMTIDGLEPKTRYMFAVQGWSEKGSSAWTPSLLLETEVGVPFMPGNVKEDEVTNTSILVKWDEPRPIRGPIEMYSIKWQEGSNEILQKYTNVSFFLIEQLIPYQIYSIQVSAKTQAGFGNWSDPITVRTNAGIPFRPGNVKEDEVTNTSILVKWDEPRPIRGPIEMYSIKWQEGSNEILQKYTNVSFFLIEQLIPYQIYSIQVSAKTQAGFGNWSDPITVRTNAGIPFRPGYVKEDEVTNTSILVKWDEPRPIRGPIEMYSIKWQEGSNEILQKYTNVSFFLIEQLIPYQIYSIQVSAKTQAGFGNWSDPITVRTNAGIPFRPGNVKEDEVTNTSILVKWDEPRPIRGPIEMYSIKWQEGSNEILQKYTNVSFFLIEQLIPYQIYSIQVSAKTQAGFGNWSDPITVQTNAGIPFRPGYVKEDEVTNTSILVKWDEPRPIRGPIEMYSIKWQEGSNEILQKYTNVSFFLIEQLIPYQIYSIQVSAKTQAGFGNWSDPITVRTNAGIPLLPRNVKEYEVTNTSIFVKWDEPLPTRGPIEKYLIEWQEEGFAQWEQKFTIVPSYLIKELTPCRKYLIRVSAETEAGLGNWTNPIIVSTTTGLPMVPKNVKIFSSETESLEIHWEEPEPHMGNIVSYSIRWGNRGRDLKSNDITNGTFYIIENLSAYTWYSVQVRATTDAGDGEWSKPVDGRTDIGIPSQPREFREKTNRTTNTSIEVEWEEPIPANGPIVNYTVRWTNLDNNLMKSSITKEKTYVIKQLEPYTNYSVQVRAATIAGFGNWTDVLVIRTETGVPLKPKNLKSVTVLETSIHLKWEEPVPMVGYITHYDVEWSDESTNFTVTEKVQNLYFIITNLSAYTNYIIRIRAATCAGSGDWSDAILLRTLSGVPLPPKSLKEKEVTNLTICINWKEPSPFKGPILSYTIRWKHSASKKVDNASTENTSYCIQKLEPYTSYEIDVRSRTAAGFGDWSSSKKIQTAVGIPTAIKDLKSFNKTAWTIYLTWSPPVPSNGPLQEYEVKWGEHLTPEKKRNLTKENFFVAENLTPFTNYTFIVSASTKVGFGSPSDPFIVQTEIAVPSAPVNLELVSATNISIMLKWKQPVAPNGPISGYTVSWKTTHGGDSPQVVAVQPILQHNIIGLLPYKNYSIQVSAKTSAGSGPWSDTLVASTKIGVPKPAQVSSISVENSTTIVLEWSTIEPYPGPTTYVLQVWRKPSLCNPGSNDILETSKEGTRGSGEWKFKKPVTIEGLTPFSEYYVRILLKTSVAESASSKSSVVKTPPDSPDVPRKVEAECKESTETIVRWKSPFKPNGKIIEYLVRYGVEYSGWSEEAVIVEDECQENHSIRLTGLRPERKYKIYVRAKAENVEENGAEASIKGYCVLPAGIPPLSDINSVTIHGSGPHTLGLEWNKNTFSDNMGDIIYYAVIVGVSEAATQRAAA